MIGEDKAFKLGDFSDDTDVKINMSENSEVGNADKKKQSFRMSFEDFERILEFRNYKIIKEKEKSYNLSDAFSEGIELLAKHYKVKRGQEETKFKTGRRTGKNDSEQLKHTSAILPSEDISLMGAIVYHVINNKGNVEYTIIEFVHEILEQIEKKYKGKF